MCLLRFDSSISSFLPLDYLRRLDDLGTHSQLLVYSRDLDRVVYPVDHSFCKKSYVFHVIVYPLTPSRDAQRSVP